MTNYAKGRRAEYRVMRYLEGQGWQTMRSAGSHGVFDVIAWRPSTLAFIQIDTSQEWRRISKKKITDFIAAAALTPTNALIEFWWVRLRQKEVVVRGVNRRTASLMEAYTIKLPSDRAAVRILPPRLPTAVPR